MPNKSKIGVCMDYSIAYLLEEKNEGRVITIIESSEEPISKAVSTEQISPSRNQRKDHVFFKKVYEIVKDFDKVLLFGPPSAKNELLNRIKANKLLHIEFHSKLSKEQITDNEKIEFINSYFDDEVA